MLLNDKQKEIIEKMKAGYLLKTPSGYSWYICKKENGLIKDQRPLADNDVWPMFCADYFEFIKEGANVEYSWYRLDDSALI